MMNPSYERLMLLRPLIGLGLASCLVFVACGDSSVSKASSGTCPSTKVAVVVTVDQWGDIVSDLAGSCGVVTTIIKSSSVDPHEYEPTAGDNATFTKAQLVVINGLDYDPWANKAIDTLSKKPMLINGGEVVGRKEGDNPHLWYGPEYVYQVADAVTAALKQLSPSAAAYLDERHQSWKVAMKPYDDAVAAAKLKAMGKTFGATESVFDYMASAVGLTNATPQGYQNAASNGSDPAPGDVNDFESALRSTKMNVLIYNTQTEGAVPAQLRKVADTAKLPVVEVTETVKPGSKGFVDWQVKQLESLTQALR